MCIVLGASACDSSPLSKSQRRYGCRLLTLEVLMNRRKFVMQSVAAGLATSGTMGVDLGEMFAADAPVGASRNVSVAAKPAPIILDVTKTVVMVVDMQNDFGSKGGMFDRA